MHHSADLYQAFFKATSDAVFVIDEATKTIIEANAQALNDTGYRPEELKGFPIDHVFRLQNGLGFSCLSQISDDASKTSRGGLQLVKMNGDTIVVNVSTICIEWDSTKYLFIVARKMDAMLPVTNFPLEDNSTSWSELRDFPAIIGQSEKIRDVCRLIGSVAKSDITVLIQGESGTGKEIVANAIHAHSHRSHRPFVKVNCAALTETLLESELFGHVKGAFTGAIRDRRGRFKQADGGTILLDEIGSMSLAGQAKLLRVLQEREFEPVGSSITTTVDVRVVTSTNADLTKAVAEGRFWEDLYYRLNVFFISLPPLRDRKEDIPLLAQHFLHQYSQAVGKEIHALAPETLSLLIEHNWPGNVRELENAVEYVAIVEKGPIVSPTSLPMNLTKSRDAKNDCEPSAKPGLREKLNLFERQILLEALLRANWVKKQAAVMLRIDPRNLPYLLRKHHLSEGFRLN